MLNAEQKMHLSFFDVFRFVAGYWRRQPKKLALFIALFSVAAFVETIIPTSLSAFLGAVREQKGAATVLLYLGAFIGIYTLQLVLRWGSYIVYNKFETRLFKDLMNDAFVHVHRLSEQFFSNNFTGGIISKITRARTRIEPFQDHLFHRIMPTAIILVGSIVFLALRFPLLAVLLGLYVVFLVGVSVVLVLRLAGPVQSVYANAQDTTVAQLADSISGIATTKAYAQEKHEIRSFADQLESLREKNHKAYSTGTMIGTTQNALLVGMLALLLGGGTWYFLKGKASVEDMAYLVMAYTILQSYLRELAYLIRDLLTSSYDLHAVIGLLRQKPEITDKPEAKALSVPHGAIDFNHVTFSYPGKSKPIFEDFTLSIKAGERIALVGHSGSGKTTFLRLLQRAYDVQHGSISIDGQNIAEHTQESLRSNIALVPQEPILFHRAISENIAYARPQASLEDIRRAAERAHIDAFIQSLPERYDTFVGERGVKLSGGERQRVAIARALLADRPILILDEATSSLDSVSEKSIQLALHTLIQGRTSIMVAHRLSTILDADRILVFDHGKIVEQGTHAELLARNGLYANLFKIQSGGFIVDDQGEPDLESPAVSANEEERLDP